MLYIPFGTAVDSIGNVFIADTYNNRIREVVKSTGNIITVAGTGTPGYGGDNGPATSALLEYPHGVAVDASGNLFIADSYNDRIREVVKATGNIITVAGNGSVGYSGDGGPATSARLNDPFDVAVDGSGNVFFSDQGNNRIREVVKATGNIITVAGTGTAGYNGDGEPATSAEVNEPSGVAVDSSGNIFIADWHNNRIREVVKVTGAISTVAGTGTGGYSGDGGPATSAQVNYPNGVAVDGSDNVFIGDSSNNRVREVVKATGIITTIAGTGTSGFSGDGGPATSAQVNYPNGVAVDDSGDVFITDTYNSRIREVVKATGNIITVAGTGTPGFSGDGGPATSARLYYPTGVAVDSSGNLYIADLYNNRIREVVKATGAITTIAGNGGTTDSGDGGLATSAGIASPQAVAVDGSGNVYIADFYTNRIREVVKGA
jgi:ribosomal protein S11